MLSHVDWVTGWSYLQRAKSQSSTRQLQRVTSQWPRAVELMRNRLDATVQAGVPMSISNVHPKISREFSLRLDRLQPRDKVRALVMLRSEGISEGSKGSAGKRPSRA